VPIGSAIIDAIAARLADHAGLELPAWLVEARASSRIAVLGIAPADYVTLIASSRGTAELERLIEAVRVGESRLFRHRGQIAALVDDVVPRLRAAGKRAIKIWSAGCSTGEEPYTLAAVLAGALPGWTISIIATDVSQEALTIAKRRAYPLAAYADVPEDWRDAFEVEGDVVRVRPEIAALVTFERANLVDRNAHRGFDLVWCRNVLIYFTSTARRQVVDRLVGATSPGGYLFVGYSESLRDVPQLQAVRAGDAVYYVRGSQVAARPSPLPAAHEGTTGHAAASSAAAIAPVHRFDAREVTPPPTLIPQQPPDDDVLVLPLRPNARELASVLSARLAVVGLRRLVIDLDPAELLEDELAPVLARARAAARAAYVELVLRASRAGTRRWLARHELDTDEVLP
jgi:chemotaxis protein methyltransferase CheR